MSDVPSDIESEEIRGIIQNNAYNFSKNTYRSALAQFYLANKWANRHTQMGITSTVISVIAGASFITDMKFEIVSGVLALIASICIAFTTFLNPDKQKLDHYNAATNFLYISDRARFLSEVDSEMKQKSNEELKDELFVLVEKRSEITKNSPRIPTQEWDDAKDPVEKQFEKTPARA